jgi:hypothetical protein
MARKAKRKDRKRPEQVEEQEPEMTFADFLKARLAEDRPEDHPVFRNISAPPPPPPPSPLLRPVPSMN